jgi:hypothetical protein
MVRRARKRGTALWQVKAPSLEKEAEDVRSVADYTDPVKTLVKSELEEVDLAALYVPGSSYTPEEKMSAAMAYLTTGSSIQAAKHCKVPATTIRKWKEKAAWWPEAIRFCRVMKNEELDGLLTSTIHLCVNGMLDQLHRGEIHVNKDGSISRQPIAFKNLAVAMAIMWDKRNLQRGEFGPPGSDKNTTQQLDILQQKFTEFAQSQLSAPYTIQGVKELENNPQMGQ